MQSTCRKKQHKANQHRRSRYFQCLRQSQGVSHYKVTGFISLADIQQILQQAKNNPQD